MNGNIVNERKTVAILKEKKANEKRVILLPPDIEELVRNFNVIVERGAAEALGISDSEYEKYGAQIVDTVTAWKADVILKYKAPIEEEYKYFTSKTIIAAIFHAEGNEKLIEMMMKKKCTAYTYEFIESDDNYFPLASPGGEIAGKMAVMYANHFLQTQFGGKGKTLFSVRGAKKAKVAVIGYGNVGGAAIKLASNLGNEVYVFGTNVNKMNKIANYLNEDVKYYESTNVNLKKILPEMDVIIGAILISTFDTEPIVTNEIINSLSKGTVVVDVTCGYGLGYIPSITKNTSLEKPYYINENGIIFIKIDNLPAAYPISTTEAYSHNAKKWLIKLVNHALNIENYSEVNKGNIIKNGEIVHPVIKEHWCYYKR